SAGWDTGFQSQHDTGGFPVILNPIKLIAPPWQINEIIAHGILVALYSDHRDALFKRCQGWQANAAVRDYKTGDVRIRNDAAVSEETRIGNNRGRARQALQHAMQEGHGNRFCCLARLVMTNIRI